MKRCLVVSIIAGIIFSFSSRSNAGIYSDDLARCLVESSTPSDKIILVKWMFTPMSLHPAVKSIASVSDEQVDKSNKEAADTIVKLITETCKDQTVKAIKYEGEAAIRSSFNVFGNVAAGIAGMNNGAPVPFTALRLRNFTFIWIWWPGTFLA